MLYDTRDVHFYASTAIFYKENKSLIYSWYQAFSTNIIYKLYAL